MWNLRQKIILPRFSFHQRRIGRYPHSCSRIPQTNSLQASLQYSPSSILPPAYLSRLASRSDSNRQRMSSSRTVTHQPCSLFSFLPP
jgi:hypothetical protein